MQRYMQMELKRAFCNAKFFLVFSVAMAIGIWHFVENVLVCFIHIHFYISFYTYSWMRRFYNVGYPVFNKIMGKYRITFARSKQQVF